MEGEHGGINILEVDGSSSSHLHHGADSCGKGQTKDFLKQNGTRNGIGGGHGFQWATKGKLDGLTRDRLGDKGTDNDLDMRRTEGGLDELKKAEIGCACDPQVHGSHLT